MASSPSKSPTSEEQQQTFSVPTRWEIELEFVQSLSNIQYVYFLAQQGYLQQREFQNYVSYLQYWKEPEYSKFLVYPNCLHVLTLLQNDQFAKDIQNPEFRNSLMNDMVERWQSAEPTVESVATSESQPPQQPASAM
ncbi:mediator of RNA polymerase II transcription subunit 31 [Diutina catenulata]